MSYHHHHPHHHQGEHGTVKEHSVFVGNVPYDVTEAQLVEMFSQVGPVMSYKPIVDKETGRPKGYGFIEYADKETALSAIRNLNLTIKGRQLRIDYAANPQHQTQHQQGFGDNNSYDSGQIGGRQQRGDYQRQRQQQYPQQQHTTNPPMPTSAGGASGGHMGMAAPHRTTAKSTAFQSDFASAPLIHLGPITPQNFQRYLDDAISKYLLGNQDMPGSAQTVLNPHTGLAYDGVELCAMLTLANVQDFAKAYPLQFRNILVSSPTTMNALLLLQERAGYLSETDKLKLLVPPLTSNPPLNLPRVHVPVLPATAGSQSRRLAHNSAQIASPATAAAAIQAKPHHLQPQHVFTPGGGPRLLSAAQQQQQQQHLLPPPPPPLPPPPPPASQLSAMHAYSQHQYPASSQYNQPYAPQQPGVPGHHSLSFEHNTLLSQIMSLSDDQIRALPPHDRDQVLKIRQGLSSNRGL